MPDGTFRDIQALSGLTRPWDRQEGEPARAYAAFKRYLEIGTARTEAIWVQLVVREGLYANVSAARSAWRGHYVRRFWDQRCRAYDQWVTNNHLTGQPVTAVQAVAWDDYWETVRREHRLRAVGLSTRILEKVAEMLDHPLTRQVIEEDEEGRPVTIIEPAGWKYSDIAKLLEVADRVMRITAEMDRPSAQIDLDAIRTEAEAIAERTGQTADEVFSRILELARAAG